jgi:subtilisin family serine protease
MDASYGNRLDPRLRPVAPRRAAGAPVAAGKKRRREPEQVLIEVANAEAAKRVKKQPGVGSVVHIVDGYYTATVEPDRLADLAATEGVIEVEALRYFRTSLHQSVGSIHGKEGMTGGGPVPDGRGVVIGIVDYGLDFTQTDFQNPPNAGAKDAHNPRGITRVAYLWDQALARKGNERAPAKYGYGVEYTSKDIDRALRKNRPVPIRHDPLRARDIQGHGTHVAGIAAGNGTTSYGKRRYPRGEYVGVAPAATIVFVSLDRSEVVRDVGTARGTIANSLNIIHAVAYCFERADALGMPCVVNLSLGSNGGGHDGSTALEWIIDALLQKSGRAVVIAAGNEDGAGKSVHATGALAKGETAALEWKMGLKNKKDPNANELEVWYPRGNAIKVCLVAPDLQASDEVEPGKSGAFRFKEGEEVRIHSDAETPWDGAARIHIALKGKSEKKGIRAGAWTLKLEATDVAPEEREGRVRFDAWIERTLPAVENQPEADSRFGRYKESTAINVTTPGTARLAISVASCENNGSPEPPISDFSSRGPTRDGRWKPELAAPGNPVRSTACAGQKDQDGRVLPARVVKGGTSAAAPHVAGVVARMLGLNAYLTAEEIRDVLIRSATPPRGGTQGQWHPKWGYGKLNAARAVELVAKLMDSSRSAP